MNLKNIPKAQSRQRTFKRINNLYTRGAYSFKEAMEARAVYSKYLMRKRK